MKIHFISFANTTSNFSNERIMYEAKKMEVFDSLTFYTEKDFDEDFLKTNGSYFETYKRGYGYWSWKPYIIKKELEKINDGDIIVYADSGCAFIRKNRKELLRWIDITAKSKSGVLSACYGPYIEHDWTRGDLHDYINKTYNKNNVDIFDKAVQCGAGVLTICKNEKSVDFINQWYDVMTNHFHLCTDEPSTLPNHPNFQENRHDQSVFSMLSKIYEIETIETKYGIINKEISPIIAARIRNDKNTWRKPIEILFDNQIFDLQRFGGISRMYADIKNELNKTNEFDVSISIETTENEYLKDSYPSGKTNNFKVSEERIKKGDFDILYPTYFYTNFLKDIGDKPYVMSVHDMIPEIYDEYFSRNDVQILGKKEMVKHASAIEVPSECTKKDLIRILGVDENKIHVVGRALNPSFGIKYYEKNILDFDYILYVGGRDYYKRFDWFIKHIKSFMDNHKDIHIVCTGKRFNDQEIKLIEQYGLRGRVNTIFADDLIMATLYKHAKFFVFPSEYEGFGLPVLESYKMGCIALLNNIEVFREITDNKGTFFTLKENESNLSEIAEKIMSLSDDEKKAILETQYKIFEKYSFYKYIDNFKSIFRNIVGRKSVLIENKPTKKVEKISVITVNFNNKDGLKKTIESVVNQTVFNKNIEYIIIDGGSTDGSADVIEEYKDRLHYCVSEKDNGIYDAMNKGVSHASGDYCIFLNSGDLFNDKDVIEKIFPHLDVDVVYGDLILNGRSVKEYPDRINVDYFNYESLPHPSSFIRRELLVDNPYKTNYGIISDWIFFRECVARGKRFKHISLAISNFYLGGASSNVKNVLNEKNRYFKDDKYDYEICVVIPCYNQEKYIKETIDSLKAQMYENFHCVIVNDGSTDKSEEVILENTKDDNRFEYYKIDNHGQSYARNFGIGKTNSKYILCLDSDDKISTTYIECAVRYLNKHEETSLFYGRAMFLYDNSPLRYWDLPKFSFKQMFVSNCIYSSCVYRRKDYIRTGGYDESMRGYEDWDFLIRLLYKNDNVYRTDDIVFYYRRHEGSIDSTVKGDAKIFKKFIIMKNRPIFADIFKNEIEKARKKREQAN